jgi:uracil-DNA glycosylase family 4
MDIKSVLDSYLSSSAIALSKDKEKTSKYIELVTSILQCRTCGILAKQPYPGSGNIDSKVMLIGEAPSPNRKSFENFSEMSKEVVDMMLISIDLDRESTYMTNAIKCPLAHANIPVKNRLTANCLKHLKAELSLIRPSAIIALGITARLALDMIRRENITLPLTIDLPHPMTVVYGSVKLKDYLNTVRKKCGLIKYLI